MSDKFKPYKEPHIGIAVAVILAIYLAAVVFLLSCNPVKKAYEGVAKYDPQTTKDSSNFYKRAKTMIKTPEVVYKPGKTVKVPYPVEKLKRVIDTAILTKITDSLEIAHASELNDIVDDCMASVKKARNEGVKAGYAQANYENYINGQEQRIDTGFYPDQSTIMLLDECQLNLRKAQTDLTTLTAQRDIYKGQSKRNFWLLILLGAGLLTSVFFNFKGKIVKKALL